MAGADKGAEKEKQNFYVGMNEPIEMRRNLLESMKSLIQIMQRYEKFKALRQEKAELLHKMRDKSREITNLCSQLRSELPKLRMPKEEIEKMKKIIQEESRKLQAAKQQVQKKEEKPKSAKSDVAKKEETPVSELDKLDLQLSAIESQLGGLK